MAFAWVWISPCWAQLLSTGDGEIYVHGVNIPWRYYGEDFGGRGRRDYDPAFYDRLFQKVSDAGLNTVRMWIHCDGRAHPQRTTNREVRPLDSRFLEDLETFIDQAASHKLLVLPVLWTFELVDSRQKDLLTNDTILESYIDQALVPMITRLKDKCNVLAWEVINEPEWAMDIRFGGTTRNTISATQMQRFVGKIAAAIHENSTHNVTLGSAGLRFNTDAFPFAKNYWHDLAFRNAGVKCEGPVLDFYSVHFYDWTLESLSPFRHPIEELELDKPVFIGEFGQHAQSTKTLLDKALSNGYAGAMPWSMMAGDDEGTWDDYEADLAEFSRGKKAIIEPNIECVESASTSTSCFLFPNPTSDEVFVHGANAVARRLNIFDGLGQLVDKVIIGPGESNTVSVKSYPSGTYVMQIAVQGSQGWVRQSTQRFLVVR